MIHAHEVRERAASFLRRDISLSSFERWLAAESQNMFSDSADEAIRLVAAISLLVSELHDEVIDYKQFRSELLPLINNINESIEVSPDLHVSSVARNVSKAYWIIEPRLPVSIPSPRALPYRSMSHSRWASQPA